MGGLVGGPALTGLIPDAAWAGFVRGAALARLVGGLAGLVGDAAWVALVGRAAGLVEGPAWAVLVAGLGGLVEESALAGLVEGPAVLVGALGGLLGEAAWVGLVGGAANCLKPDRSSVKFDPCVLDICASSVKVELSVVKLWEEDLSVEVSVEVSVERMSRLREEDLSVEVSVEVSALKWWKEDRSAAARCGGAAAHVLCDCEAAALQLALELAHTARCVMLATAVEEEVELAHTAGCVLLATAVEEEVCAGRGNRMELAVVLVMGAQAALVLATAPVLLATAVPASLMLATAVLLVSCAAPAAPPWLPPHSLAACIRTHQTTLTHAHATHTHRLIAERQKLSDREEEEGG